MRGRISSRAGEWTDHGSCAAISKYAAPVSRTVFRTSDKVSVATWLFSPLENRPFPLVIETGDPFKDIASVEADPDGLPSETYVQSRRCSIEIGCSRVADAPSSNSDARPFNSELDCAKRVRTRARLVESSKEVQT